MTRTVGFPIGAGYAGLTAARTLSRAGVSVVVIRKDLLARSSDQLGAYLNFKLHADWLRHSRDGSFRAERAVIEISDDDGNVFSLLVHPVSGRVEVRGEELRNPGEFVGRDAEGKVVNP